MRINKVKMGSVLLAILLALSLAACESKPKNNSAGQGQHKPVNEEPTKSGQYSQNHKDHAANPDIPAIMQGTGSFTGLADSHTVEIIVHGTPMSFQFGEDLNQAMEDVNPDQQVNFRYVEKPIKGETTLKQLVLTGISKLESKKKDGKDSKEEDLPKEKELDVMLEGNKEQRIAVLVHGAGYSLYIFEQFTFDKAKNVLYFNVDPRFQVRIEKLPPSFSLNKLLLEGEDGLRKYGKAVQLHGSVLTSSMKDARLFLQAQDKTGTYEYIVKEFDGSCYVFHVEIPQGEAAEGFVSLAFASLNTMQSR
ncbi:hypothetical protein [Paenibacillus sp.]|jgi:hypothetical protein|uniref:hypothetical protein n=1 Tax=Paenibacillus sp. TaxID=58172 RepID=UPI0028185F19|nr:hypothetical protein [Paenibacillus sp.]MDR0271394.1 hypothetical protein [Paenibacillus sp.]